MVLVTKSCDEDVMIKMCDDLPLARSKKMLAQHAKQF